MNRIENNNFTAKWLHDNHQVHGKVKHFVKFCTKLLFYFTCRGIYVLSTNASITREASKIKCVHISKNSVLGKYIGIYCMGF